MNVNHTIAKTENYFPLVSPNYQKCHRVCYASISYV